jgi:hypothetical protein
MRHPREMGSAEVNASTQNQALSALLFLYRELLERDLDLEGGRRDAIGLAAARRKRSADSWSAVWQWAAIDGGSAAEGA